MSLPGPVRLSVQIATAIVTDRRLRRRAMASAILISAAQCLLGTILLPASMTENPLFLFLFWGSCLLFVLIAAGLALLDVVALRKQLSLELQRLNKELHSTSQEADD